jgi:hypothetical protein
VVGAKTLIVVEDFDFSIEGRIFWGGKVRGVCEDEK